MGDELKLEFGKKATEWTVFTAKTFSVQVRGWNNYGKWAWNVYAVIYDGHPLRQNLDGALSLPFHGGATYDKRIVTSPARGVESKWDRISDVLKVGGDYAHAHDEHYETCDPADGIPVDITRDAIALAETLMGIAERAPGVARTIDPRDAEIAQLTADNAALRADLSDARSNWESGAEELRQADASTAAANAVHHITDKDAKGYRPPGCDRGKEYSACCDHGCAADRELAEMGFALPASPTAAGAADLGGIDFGYQGGTLTSDASDEATIHLHYATRHQAEAAFETITTAASPTAIDAALLAAGVTP